MWLALICPTTTHPKVVGNWLQVGAHEAFLLVLFVRVFIFHLYYYQIQEVKS